MDQCAACGKGGDDPKACMACKSVKYCNVTCQKAHRPKHKKDCKRTAAALFDEKLFRQLPKEDCPICLLPLPFDHAANTYQPCCGKCLCNGCMWAFAKRSKPGEISKCPFCRSEISDDDEELKRLQSRVEAEDAMACCLLANKYYEGIYGVSQDMDKAVELWLQGVELGSRSACDILGDMYWKGEHVGEDEKKAKHYFERETLLGDILSRFELGKLEMDQGNPHRALKHWIIAAKAGHSPSLHRTKMGYQHGLVTKDEFEKILRAHKDSVDDVRSEWRDEYIADKAKISE